MTVPGRVALSEVSCASPILVAGVPQKIEIVMQDGPKRPHLFLLSNDEPQKSGPTILERDTFYGVREFVVRASSGDLLIHVQAAAVIDATEVMHALMRAVG